MATVSAESETVHLTGPFDSLRDYIRAIEARGTLLRIAAMDQDRFEATGFAYRMVEEHGFDNAPPSGGRVAFTGFDRIRDCI